MISMSLREASAVVRGECLGDDVRFHGCSIDSRAMPPEGLFIAMRGERVDGHDFLDSAAAAGAAAAMVERDTASAGLPRLLVPAARDAMARLAAHWRAAFELPLVAVTGSNGKTTVKSMLGAILASHGMQALATEGNLNNELGVPLTLFRLKEGCDCAVVEMGAAAVGDIAYLVAIAKPTVAVVTQCAPAHLQGFGSIEAVARTKGEIFSGLPADGVAVINIDDEYSGLWQSLAAHARQLHFGLGEAAQVRPEDVRCGLDGSEFNLLTPSGKASVRLPLPGQHNVVNALAAAACAHALGLGPEDIAAGLAKVTPPPGRLEKRDGINGCVILDDSYNANPGSLLAGLDLLRQYRRPRWLILGEMAELGDAAAMWHRQAGEEAKNRGVERLFTVGGLPALAAELFGEGACEYPGDEALLAQLEAAPEAPAILVKGSRLAAMERIVRKLAVER